MRLLLAVLLSGCQGLAAVKRRAPCKLHVDVSLTEEPTPECVARGAVTHDDKKPGEVYGCADATDVTSNGTESNLGHEMWYHVVPRNCPQWGNQDKESQ